MIELAWRYLCEFCRARAVHHSNSQYWPPRQYEQCFLTRPFDNHLEGSSSERYSGVQRR